MLSTVFILLIVFAQQLVGLTAAHRHLLMSQSRNSTTGSNNGNHNSHRLLESSIDLPAAAAQTYAAVLPCLTEAWVMPAPDKEFSKWHFPSDALAHFEDLKRNTESFRQFPMIFYAGYHGPWVENVFIERFLNKPLEYFNGFIPLFIQWNDIEAVKGRYVDPVLDFLDRSLRKNVIYLAVSEADNGLERMVAKHPNILVLSSGGNGHIPIPQILGLKPVVPYAESNITQALGFFGSVWFGRKEILAAVAAEAAKANLTYKEEKTPLWQLEMERTKFNLAPRGNGRTSNRYTDSVQMGRIPVYLYNDIPWMPYEGTECSAEKIGFVGGLNHKEHDISEMVRHMSNLSEHQFWNKMHRLKACRHVFTYDGVMDQIEHFLKHPFHSELGGYLRCQKYPTKATCCDP